MPGLPARPLSDGEGMSPLTMAELREAQAGPGRLSEKAFSQQVYDLARLLGWVIVRFPTWRPTGTTPGFPDIMAVRRGRIILAELKAEDGKLTPAQRKWLWTLAEAGAEVYVFKPSMWPQVERVLR